MRPARANVHLLGHYGAALLVYALPGAWLLATGRADLAVLGGAGMVLLSMAPDVDKHVPRIDHRGPTHSLLFATVLGAGIAAVVAVAAYATTAGDGSIAVSVGLFGFAIGGLSALSHLAADVLTPMGIRPLWPLSRRRISVNVTLASDPTANYALFAAGLVATAIAVLVGRTSLPL